MLEKVSSFLKENEQNYKITLAGVLVTISIIMILSYFPMEM